MSRHPFFRVFLMLALMLNGLAAAHAAVGHALMQMPVLKTAAVGIAQEAGCHDMHHGDAAQDPVLQDHAAPEKTPDSLKHKGSSCCQGSVCNCACAMQMPVSLSGVADFPRWQSLQSAHVPAGYLSVDPSLILRPPIA